MAKGKEDFEVTPYEVKGAVDYNKLIERFGIREITPDLETRLAKYAGDLHFLIRRHIFFAHRELDWLLDKYEQGEHFYVYTGIAPSGSMTIGHLVPFALALWLQERFNADVYIQIPDEEKFLARKGLTLERVHELAYDDALNIAAMGFKPKKTKIFFDTEYAGVLYKQAVRVAKHITLSTVKDAFGIGDDANIGWTFYTSMQAVPSFLKSVEENKNVPCLIPLGVDQDVHFRLARDVVDKLGYYKPAIIHNKFMPSLSGMGGKMSASDPDGTIYLSDGPEEVERKVGKAFTGQQATAALQRKYGGDPDKCTVCQYYKFFFEPDDRKLEAIFEAEKNGTLLAGEHKKDLAKRINAFLRKHNERKSRARSKIESFIARG